MHYTLHQSHHCSNGTSHEKDPQVLIQFKVLSSLKQSMKEVLNKLQATVTIHDQHLYVLQHLMTYSTS
uniref:Uncharacterized protein n=1 Tax=Amphimedon queenslandica TaxID=400682 RepID=A0A1X7V8I5_AMPQE